MNRLQCTLFSNVFHSFFSRLVVTAAAATKKKAYDSNSHIIENSRIEMA